MKSVRPVYCIVIVFLLGLLGGALSTHFYYKCRSDHGRGLHGQQREEFLVNRLDRELSFTPTQKEQVKVIVRETMQEIRQVRRQFRPQMEAIIEKSQQKVDVLLTPEQRKKFEKIIAERKERARNWDR
jgi:Spy/CpxP family protein refolding chaperone